MLREEPLAWHKASCQGQLHTAVLMARENQNNDTTRAPGRANECLNLPKKGKSYQSAFLQSRFNILCNVFNTSESILSDIFLLETCLFLNVDNWPHSTSHIL